YTAAMGEVTKKPDGEVKHVEDNGTIDSPFKVHGMDSDTEFGGTEERMKLEKKLLVAHNIPVGGKQIDRNNAAAARLRGFEGDLGLKDQEFPTILSIFYVGYILMQVPSNMFLNYIGKPSLYLPVCMILWGGISCLTGITHSFVPALLTRFFLGFVEAAFFPGALFVLSKWYKREELGLRTAILYCGSLSSNAFGGLLAAGILDGMEGKLGHAAWRWLFYVEGAITIAVAILAVFILPDFPSTSNRWLSPTEQRLAELRMVEDAGGEADQDSSMEGPFYGFMLTVKDWKVWWLSVALTAQVVGLSFNSYFPTLTSTLGYSRTVSLLLCAPPWAFASRLDRGEEIDGIRDMREVVEDAAELQGVSVKDIQQARKGFRVRRPTTIMSSKQTDAELEAAALNRVLEAFRNYRQYSLSANQRRRQDYLKLPESERALLDSVGWKQKVAHIDAAIERNAEFLLKIIDDPMIFQGMDLEGAHGHDDHDHGHDHGGHSHGPGHSHDHDHGEAAGGHEHEHSHGHSGRSRHTKRSPQMDFDMDKVRSTLKQFVRDWGVEGKVERDACYGPMLDALCEYFHDVPVEERGNFRVLVPGAGLGRLAWDVAARGFACQGNEFSHYMLLASYFVLNRTRAKFEHTIHPFIHSISNTVSARSLLRAVQVPDVLPSDLPPGSNFSLVAGDFEEIYGVEPDSDSNTSGEPEPHAGEWDAVLTCFFIDTAKNIVSYLKTIHKILAPGGVWINLGPLLWHWENNNTNDMSIELDLEEVKELARKIGFEIYNEKTIPTTYTGNSESMLGYVYQASFWTATKIPAQQQQS
ncbi:unnamed protein product, partial [Rhizoctonia solani]